MSNESNREDIRTISPSDLQACDFFPPGEGWNKQEVRKPAITKRDCEDQDEGFAAGTPRQH